MCAPVPTLQITEIFSHCHFFSFCSTDRFRRETSSGFGVRRVADVRMHVRTDAGCARRVEFQARRGRPVRGHRGCICRCRPIGMRHRARGLRARPGAGGHPLDGAHARDSRLFCHGRHSGRAHHDAADRNPVDAQHAARQASTYTCA